MDVLVATYNPGKVQEYRELLVPLEATPVFPLELGLRIDVPEDAATYVENATQKASAHARASGLVTLADDSGLEVDALGGAPGIRSARYTPGQDADRTAALLAALSDVPLEQRTARFRCTVVIDSPDGPRYHAEGVCEGLITLEPSGSGGFGYDPVFYLPEHGCTMAELAPEAKNRISHRARAVEAALPLLRCALAVHDPA